MDEQAAREYLARNHRGILATLRADGRPQLSPIVYAVDDEGWVNISTTQDRAKVANVRRDPRVSMQVLGDDFYEYIVVDGEATLDERDPLPRLRWLYQAIRGEPHPDWADYDAAMLRDRRLVLRFSPGRFYPLGR